MADEVSNTPVPQSQPVDRAKAALEDLADCVRRQEGFLLEGDLDSADAVRGQILEIHNVLVGLLKA